jgi:hypothetical protein
MEVPCTKPAPIFSLLAGSISLHKLQPSAPTQRKSWTWRRHSPAARTGLTPGQLCTRQRRTERAASQHGACCMVKFSLGPSSGKLAEVLHSLMPGPTLDASASWPHSAMSCSLVSLPGSLAVICQHLDSQQQPSPLHADLLVDVHFGSRSPGMQDHGCYWRTAVHVLGRAGCQSCHKGCPVRCCGRGCGPGAQTSAVAATMPAVGYRCLHVLQGSALSCGAEDKWAAAADCAADRLAAGRSDAAARPTAPGCAVDWLAACSGNCAAQRAARSAR